MKKINSVNLGIFGLALVLFGLVVLIKIGVDKQIDEENKQKKVLYESYTNEAYELGLWDGFNLTLKYLNEKKYLKDDSINIELSELIKALHPEKNNKNGNKN